MTALLAFNYIPCFLLIISSIFYFFKICLFLSSLLSGFIKRLLLLELFNLISPAAILVAEKDLCLC
jgi:hypothetical protein